MFVTLELIVGDIFGFFKGLAVSHYIFSRKHSGKQHFELLWRKKKAGSNKKAQALDTRNFAQATLLARNNKYDLQAA